MATFDSIPGPGPSGSSGAGRSGCGNCIYQFDDVYCVLKKYSRKEKKLILFHSERRCVCMFDNDDHTQLSINFLSKRSSEYQSYSVLGHY